MWELHSILLVVAALELKSIIEINLIRVGQHCINHYLNFNSCLRQLHISNKTKYFSFKGGCSVCEHHICKGVFNGGAAWATDKLLWIISN